jgi:hypothetical protein
VEEERRLAGVGHNSSGPTWRAAAIGNTSSMPPALDRALVAPGAGAQDVADFKQRRGEQCVDGENPPFSDGVRRWLDLTTPPLSPDTRLVGGTFVLCMIHTTNVAIGFAMTTERNKRERFIELGEARVRKATQMLRLIGNLSNASNYEYTPDDAYKIISTLDNEIKLLKAKFQAALVRRSKNDFKLG